MAYAMLADGFVRRLSDNAIIPPDPRNADFYEFQRWVDDGGVAEPYVPPAPLPYEVRKLLMIERLAEAALLRAAYLAMKMDDPASSLTDAELTLRERFRAASVLRSDDTEVRGLITAVGGDPDEILAPE